MCERMIHSKVKNPDVIHMYRGIDIKLVQLADE